MHFKKEAGSLKLRSVFILLFSSLITIYGQGIIGSFRGEELNKSLDYGYGYDSLLIDLNSWSQSPYVEIDSIGETPDLGWIGRVKDVKLRVRWDSPEGAPEHLGAET